MKFRSRALLGFLLALCSGSALCATPFRLFEVFAVRYIRDTSGATIEDSGVFSALGEFHHQIYRQLAAGTTVPAEAMDRPLLPYGVWLGYDALGQEAMANFDLSRSVFIGTGPFFVLAMAAHPNTAIGTVPNLSSRGTIAPGGDPLISGFVIVDHPRRVLIRGVGPTLGSLNVTAPLANPTLTLYRQNMPAAVATNDDWGQQANVSDIEAAAAAAGAFALPRDSKDAVLLIELPAGIYTTHLGSADGTGGSALLEIYILP